MNLANKLTIFRMILVPIMVIIPFLGIENEIFGIPLIYLIIDIIFIIASITDKLDGYIARSRNNNIKRNRNKRIQSKKRKNKSKSSRRKSIIKQCGVHKIYIIWRNNSRRF